MGNREDVAYCGLYCRLCGMKSRVPQTASALREVMSRDGWEFFGEFVLPEFMSFWKALGTIAGYEKTCPGCRGGCGNPDCAIRKCALAKGLEICTKCSEYPCASIEALALRYPNLVCDGKHQRDVGLEQWLSEQEHRRESGFCYCDIRIPETPPEAMEE